MMIQKDVEIDEESNDNEDEEEDKTEEDNDDNKDIYVDNVEENEDDNNLDENELKAVKKRKILLKKASKIPKKQRKTKPSQTISKSNSLDDTDSDSDLSVGAVQRKKKKMQMKTKFLPFNLNSVTTSTKFKHPPMKVQWMVDLIPKRGKQNIYDVSNSDTQLLKDKTGVDLEEIESNSETKSSNQLLQMIIQKFEEEYKMSKNNEVKKVEDYLRQKMKLNACYAIFDTEKIQNKHKYRPKSVIIMERTAWVYEGLNGKGPHTDICIIQAYMEDSDPLTGYLELLLHFVFNDEEFRNKDCYVVMKDPNMISKKIAKTKSVSHKPGIKTQTVSQILENMEFEETSTEILGRLVEPGSIAHKSNGSHIRIKTRELKFDKSDSYRIICLNGDTKIKAKFDNNKYHLYTHPLLWNEYDTDDVAEYLSENQSKSMVKNASIVHYFKGGGHRKKYDSIFMKDRNKDEKVIHSKFQQSQFDSGSNCVWLSSCMLINTIDEKTADYMLGLLQDNISNENSNCKGIFEWMLFSGIPDNQIEINATTLQDKLQKDKHIPYQLKKIKKDAKYFKAYIIDPETYGNFLCQLESNTGQNTHVVGIDTTNNKIYDCLESFILELNEINLNHCCGPYQGGLNKIKRCYQIIEKHGKKSTK